MNEPRLDMYPLDYEDINRAGMNEMNYCLYINYVQRFYGFINLSL